MQPPAALYVHVPFCRAKCRYCDFYSLSCPSAGGADARRYATAVLAELRAQIDLLDRPLQSIFFGGGTPTALGPEVLSQLLADIAPLAGPQTEFSMEANPGVFDPAIADVLRRHGVNRLNFGVQSFIPDELKLLGRIHSPQQARDAFDLARRSGFDNVGLDLIYAIPGQTPETWNRSLTLALELNPSHLSCYALSFEEGTPLNADLAAGRVTALEDSLQKALYETAIARASAAGLEHYEISNFARPGRQCRHNLTYWANRTYLGVGPAAASYVGGVRRTNFADLDRYCRCIEQGASAVDFQESLTLRQRMAETLMLGLRRLAGVDCREFSARFGQSPQEAFPQSLPRYLAQGALAKDGDFLHLTHWAIFASDTVLSDIVAEADPVR